MKPINPYKPSIEMFPGRKTYIVAATMIAVSIGTMFFGEQPSLEAFKTVLEALAIAALRLGISKAE